MILDTIATVTVGQIMTRVTIDGVDDGEEIKVLTPKAIVSGIINYSDISTTRIKKPIDEEKYTREGDVVIKLSTPYDAAYITKEFEGLAVPSFCAIIRLVDSCISPKFLSAYLNSNYACECLKSTVVGSAKPMIKVSDIRAMDIPLLANKDMRDIGEAFILSGQKRLALIEMERVEAKLMESIIMNSIKEAMDNG